MTNTLLQRTFDDIFGFSYRKGQQELFEELIRTIESEKTPRFIVRLPCGYGKTEAASAPFFAQYLIDYYPLSFRMIYVLPTRALCNQIFSRFLQWKRKVETLTGKKLLINVHHGAALSDPYFISDITITTLDQFIYCYCRNISVEGRRKFSHVEMAAGGIGLSYVVFDEAHMYSSYTHALMRRMIEILYRANVPFLVMTATMPQSLECDLFRDMDVERVEYHDKGVIGRGVVNVSFVHNNILTEIERYLNGQNDSVLIVCNTVRQAQDVYNRIEKMKKRALLIHSRYRVNDRNELEGQVTKSIGKEGKGTGVIISTQVCEVGLDVSANLLLTELAPADSLIQRLGRCARWGGTGDAYIFNVENTAPYDEESVRRTKVYLESDKLDVSDWDSTTKFLNVLNSRIDEVSANEALRRINESVVLTRKFPEAPKVREDEDVALYIPQTQEPTKPITWEELSASIVHVPIAIVRKKASELLFLEDKKAFTATVRYSKWRVIWEWETHPLIINGELQISDEIYLGKPEAYDVKLGLVA